MSINSEIVLLGHRNSKAIAEFGAKHASVFVTNKIIHMNL